MNLVDIEKVEAGLRRAQQRWRIVFAALLLGALAVVVLFLTRSTTKAVQSQHEASVQTMAAEAATRDLGKVSDDMLKEILRLDEETSQSTSPYNPAVFVWKGGLYAKRTDRSVQFNPKVLALINTRRYLISGLSPSLLNASSELKAYTCAHAWFVIAMSKVSDDSEGWLKSQRDPRFTTAAWVSGPLHPSQRGLVVGWFLTQADADILIEEIQGADKTNPFKNVWDFGPQTCSIQGTRAFAPRL